MFASSGRVAGLVALILVQWVLIAFLLVHNQVSQQNDAFISSSSLCKVLRESASFSQPNTTTNCEGFDKGLPQEEKTPEPEIIPPNDMSKTMYSEPVANYTKWEGVALGLMLKRPRWFYKRYNMMIHNALANIPPHWGMQLMVQQDFFESELLDYHRGLKRVLMEDHPRIVVNILPPEIAKKKPRDVLKFPWLWQHIVGERIVMFHGTGALCSNTNKSWADLEPYHYVGLPWNSFQGRGGWGTEFSYRRKSAMIAAIQHHNKHHDLEEQFSGGAEDHFFISTLLNINQQEGKEVYRVASPEVTEWFGGTNVERNGTLDNELVKDYGPLVVVGTLGHLSDSGRMLVLGTCVEIKGVFPTLHNPGCFGAKPNMPQCAASLGFPPPCPTAEESKK